MNHLAAKIRSLLDSDLSWLVVIYVLGYALFVITYGSSLNDQEIANTSQYLHPTWLKENLFYSLLYLHSQPPLMNLILGIIYKISEEHHAIIFRIFYIICGLWAVYALNQTLKIYQISRVIRDLILSILCIYPTLHLFDTWYYCTHLEFCLFATATYWLCSFYAKEQSITTLCKLFITFLLLGLLRAQWHLLIFLLISSIILLSSPHSFRRSILLASIIFILPLAGLYSKNYLMFGFWGASSWMGSNMAQVAIIVEKPEHIAAYKKRNLINRNFKIDIYNIGLANHYVPKESLSSTLPKAITEHQLPYQPPKPNSHYYGIINTSAQDMKDALFIIRNNPVGYIRYVMKRIWTVIQTPSSFHPYVSLAPIKASIPQFLWKYCAIIAQIMYLWIPLIVVLIEYRRSERQRWRPTLILFLVAFMMLTAACALNGAEQERMRWGWQPVYIIFAAIFLENIKQWCHRKRHV